MCKQFQVNSIIHYSDFSSRALDRKPPLQMRDELWPLMVQSVMLDWDFFSQYVVFWAYIMVSIAVLDTVSLFFAAMYLFQPFFMCLHAFH